MAHYNIVIVGAGPAGSCLARLLSLIPNLSVAIVDARRLDCPFDGSSRIKSCGGLVAPDAQKALACMDMALPKHVLVTPQLFAVRTIDITTGLERYYQRFYMNLDREAFDRWLFAGISSSVTSFLSTSVVTIMPEANGHTVQCSDGTLLHARFIVGADGANSVVRRKLFPPLPVDRYISIQERYTAPTSSPHFAAFFDATLTDYYGWGLPKDMEYLLGMAFPEGKGAKQAFEQFKQRIHTFGYNLGTPHTHEATLLLRPGCLPGSGIRPDNTACLLGEAGGYVSPSSAEGFSYAFRTAAALYRSLTMTQKSVTSEQFFPDVCRLHKKLMWPIRLGLWSKSIKRQVLYRPLPREIVMRSGINSLYIQT